RFAMHHFPDPARVLGEMARVCRIGGKIGLEDIVASEHRAKADFHNQFERLRDTSHTRFLALSELAAQVARAGFDLKKFTSLELDNPVERWLETTQTPPDRAAKVREMIERDVAEDLSGADARRVGGALHFTHRAAILVGKRLA
ncbi:MAG TPA: hypothetical protein VEJ86_14185, partial [Candidatus Binataceae bacterium]|nr:hypothetical protein [Candidatus Binataceae bacterium]